MSSIISDIFYNSKNNALLDHYLNHNLDRSEQDEKLLLSHSKQQEHTKKQTHQIYPKSNSFISDVSHSYPHPPNLTLIFRIVINLNKTEPQNSTNFVVKLQIGIASLQQSLKQINNILTTELPISLPLEEITSNSAVTITLSAQRNHHQTISLIGCCYLPTENIRHMMDNEIHTKIFTLWMKEVKSTPKMRQHQSGNGKYKVECEVSIEGGSGREQSTDSLARQWKYAPKQKIVQEQASLVMNNGTRNWRREKKTTRSKLVGEKQSLASHKNLRQKQAGSFYSSHFSKVSQLSANQSDNMILKFQLDNRPTRFIIRQYRPNLQSQQSEAYCFSLQSGKQVMCGEEVLIRSSDVDKKGVIVTVIKQGAVVGAFHLSIVALMGGYVQGEFPVCAQGSGQCVGVIIIEQPEEKRGKNTIMPKQQRRNHNAMMEEDEHEEERNGKVNGCIMSLAKLLILRKEQALCQLDQQPAPCIIVRYSETIQKMSKQCSLHPCGTLPSFFQLRMDQPIILYSNSATTHDAEVEIYISGDLVGYGRISLPVSTNSSRATNHILYGSLKQNLTTDDWICNAIINYAHFSLAPDYFPPSHLQTSLKFLGNLSCFHKFSKAKNQTVRSNFHSTIMEQILDQDPKMIRIQAHRIADLICEAIICQGLSFLKVEDKQQQNYINHQEGNLKRFYEELQFLDEKGSGYVKAADLFNVIQYYGISNQLCKTSRRGYFLTKHAEETDQILYLILLVGIKISLFQLPTPEIVEMENFEKKQEKSIKLATVESNIPLNLHIEPSIPGKELKIIQLEAIECRNMHTLLHNNTIPSVRVRLDKVQWSSRPCYSSANPFIKINKKIQVGELIVFSHCNVKMEREIQIGRMIFEEGKLEYALGGKAIARLLIIG